MKLDPEWCVIRRSFDVKRNRVEESIFTTGNGYLSVRGSLEEGLSEDPQNLTYERSIDNISLEDSRPGKSKWGTYIPGFMAPHPALGWQMLNLPYFRDITIAEWGESLDMENSDISEYVRWLDLKTGTLNRQLKWKTVSGQALKLSFSSFPHMKYKHLIVQSLKIECLKGDAQLTVSGGINSDVRTNGFDHFTNTQVSVDGVTMKMTVKTNGDDTIRISSLLKTVPVIHECSEAQRSVYTSLAFNLQKGDAREFIKLSSLSTSRDISSDDSEPNEVDILLDPDMSISEIREAHEKAWAERWADADIRIEGDAKSQLAVRFAVYHLIRACNTGDYRAGIGSRLASGDLYCGHVFWDNEIFLLPFYLYTNPATARDILRYRYFTLDGAKSKARRYGYAGAMYAWQSGITGEENCVAWQYPDHQIHLSADIVYGIWHYYSLTGDDTCITDFGAEIFFEVARFFAERVDKRPGDDYYSLLCVMGPDEYSPFAHNNAYTNRLAKFVFEKAGWTAEFLKKKYPDRFKEISKRIGLSAKELKAFREIGPALTVPHDEKRDLVMQSEDFEKLAPIDMDKFWTDRSKPFGLFISQERKYRSQLLKQPDVLMLMYLFPNEFTDKQKRIAFKYYEPKTCHDSSLSYPIHSIMAAHLSLNTKAWNFWRKSAFLDLNEQSHNTADGLHESSLGGTWQAVIFGFAGMQLACASEKLKFSPRLPKKWKRLSFRINWRGEKYDVNITGEEAAISRAR